MKRDILLPIVVFPIALLVMYYALIHNRCGPLRQEFHFNTQRRGHTQALVINQPKVSEATQSKEFNFVTQSKGQSQELLTNQPHMSEAKQNTEISQPVCNATFGKTIEEDIAKIKSYKLSPADKYFKELDSPAQLHNSTIYGTGPSTIELPIIVTAASSNHYIESMNMLNNLARVRLAYPAIPVYYYDIGLTMEQRTEVQKFCNCTVLDFPFDKYPAYVRRLGAFCWKPIIIKMMLKISQFVMWMDASIQFETTNLDELFTKAKQYGLMMHHNYWILPIHVSRDTFTFLDEQPCLFQNLTEYQGGFILVHTGNSLVKNYIINPWVKCALIEECMKTKNYEKKLVQCTPQKKAFHSCHRFDQAVLSILTFRLFHNTYSNHYIIAKYFSICRIESCWRSKLHLSSKVTDKKTL